MKGTFTEVVRVGVWECASVCVCEKCSNSSTLYYNYYNSVPTENVCMGQKDAWPQTIYHIYLISINNIVDIVMSVCLYVRLSVSKLVAIG